MRGTVLVCGDAANPSAPPGFTVIQVPARPDKRQDVHILPASGGRLVVVGDDAALAAVVLRLLRRELLGQVTVGFVPPRGSAVAALWGLPSDPAEALKMAMDGAAAAVPVVRDDAGGVLVGLGVLDGVNGVGYCDDELAVRGAARRIEVQPHSAGVEVRVVQGRLRRRTSTLHGRAFQFGGEPVLPVSDGVRRERPIPRWTWYRHTEDLQLARLP